MTTNTQGDALTQLGRYFRKATGAFSVGILAILLAIGAAPLAYADAPNPSMVEDPAGLGSSGSQGDGDGSSQFLGGTAGDDQGSEDLGSGGSQSPGGLEEGNENGAQLEGEDTVEEPLALEAPVLSKTTGVRSGDVLKVAHPQLAGIDAENFEVQWLRGSAPIADANGLSYVVTAADIGAVLRVSLVLNLDGVVSDPLLSAQTAKVLGASFGNVAVKLTGTASTGNVLRVQNVPAGATAAYEWKRDNSRIVGATKSSYTLTPADVDRKISVIVHLTRAGFESTKVASPAVTAKRGTIPSFSAKVTGSALVGSTLKAPGAGSAYTHKYVWKRSGKTISGATKSSYKLTSSDAGKKIRVEVTASKSGFTTRKVTTAETTSVLRVFTSASTPKLKGTQKVGSTLSVTIAKWKPVAAKYSYQWLRDGKAISGATKSTYKLTAGDHKKRITVRVTGKASGYKSIQKTSAKSAAILPGTLKRSTPTISGTVRVGSTLTVKTGTASPSATSTSYQWYANGSAISGATKRTYTLKGSDKGKTIKAKVTFKRTGYSTSSSTSKSTVKVAAKPVPKPPLYFKNCTAARAAGAAPVYIGSPGYGKHLDRDGDGVGCE